MHILELNRLAAVGTRRAVDVRGPSNAIWSTCPVFELQNGSRDGFHYWDDLMGKNIQAANVAAASTTLVDPWCAFTDATAGNTIAAVVPTETGIAADEVGAMKLLGTTTQEGVVVGLHTALNTSGNFGSPIATNRHWWEARLKISSITTQEVTLFVGLLPAAKVATPVSTVFATAGSVMAAIDHVGFMKIAAGTTAIKTVHSNGTATVLSATAGTFAADTYTKLGAYWDGANYTFYQDGVALSTQLALGVTQFPAGANLAFHVAFMVGSGASDDTATIDWVRTAYERIQG